MPEAISSNNSSSTYSDLTSNGLDEALPGPRCEPQCGNAEREMECDEGSPTVSALVTHHTKLAGNTNAERAAETKFHFLHLEAGHTGNGSLYVNAALGYGSDGQGNTLEIGSVSAQIGAQSELQGAVLRSTHTEPGASETAEILAASAYAGGVNKDGSMGANLGGGFSSASLETTTGTSASSVTTGVSLGASAEASSGTRDADADGYAEWCLRAGGGPATLGTCLEDPRGWGR